MSKLDDFIGKSEHFQGEVLQCLKDMKEQRIEDVRFTKENIKEHDGRISLVERSQYKTIYAASLLGGIAGWVAELFAGRLHK